MDKVLQFLFRRKSAVQLWRIRHYIKVYSMLSATFASTTGGACLQHSNIFFWTPVTPILGAVLAISTELHKGRDTNTIFRIMMMFAAAFILGLTLSPLIQLIIGMNVGILYVTFVGAFLMYAIFGLAVMSQPCGLYQCLHMTGLLLSVINTMILISFFATQIAPTTQTFLGLFLIVSFVVYDMRIMLRYRTTDWDSVEDAIDLYFHIFGVFSRLLYIFLEKRGIRQNRGART